MDFESTYKLNDYIISVRFKYKDDEDKNRYIRVHAISAMYAWMIALNHPIFEPIAIDKYYEND